MATVSEHGVLIGTYWDSQQLYEIYQDDNQYFLVPHYENATSMKKMELPVVDLIELMDSPLSDGKHFYEHHNNVVGFEEVGYHINHVTGEEVRIFARDESICMAIKKLFDLTLNIYQSLNKEKSSKTDSFINPFLTKVVHFMGFVDYEDQLPKIEPDGEVRCFIVKHAGKKDPDDFSESGVEYFNWNNIWMTYDKFKEYASINV